MSAAPNETNNDMDRDWLLYGLGIAPESLDLPDDSEESLSEEVQEKIRQQIRAWVHEELDPVAAKMVQSMVAASNTWMRLWGEVLMEEEEEQQEGKE